MKWLGHIVKMDDKKSITDGKPLEKKNKGEASKIMTMIN